MERAKILHNTYFALEFCWAIHEGRGGKLIDEYEETVRPLGP